MANLHISLLGRFRIQHKNQDLEGFEARKVQELLCYLLLNANQFHVRELLASRLWGKYCTTSQSKAYLRKALWKLQAALGTCPGLRESGLITVEGDCIQLSLVPQLRLDVAVLEKAYASVKGIPGPALDGERVQSIKKAIQLYEGDLLADWYQDWCTDVRVRLQQTYLIMLDKLASWCEAHGRYEAGLKYGRCILQYDRARERTHRQLMRLHYLAGYRTSALRQYEACVAELQEELDVRPARSTVELYEQIRMDQIDGLRSNPGSDYAQDAKPEVAVTADLLEALRRLQSGLADIQQQVQQVIASVRPSSRHRE